MGLLGKIEIMLEKEHLIYKMNTDLTFSQSHLPLKLQILLYHILK